MLQRYTTTRSFIDFFRAHIIYEVVKNSVHSPAIRQGGFNDSIGFNFYQTRAGIILLHSTDGLCTRYVETALSV